MNIFNGCNKVHNSRWILPSSSAAKEELLERVSAKWQPHEFKPEYFDTLKPDMGLSRFKFFVVRNAEQIKKIGAILALIAFLGVLIGLALFAAGMIIAPLMISTSSVMSVSLAVIEAAHRFQSKSFEILRGLASK